MKWFNSLKLSLKITFSFLSITIAVGIMSIFTLLSVEDLRERSQEVSEVHFEGLRLLTHIAEAYPMMLVKTRDVILSETLTQRKQYAQQINKDERDIDDWTRQLASKLPSQEEQDLYKKYTVSLQEFHSLRITAIGLAIDEQELQQANQLIYGDLNKKAEELKTTLDKLIETKEKIAKKVQEDNDKVVQDAYLILLVFGFIVLAITVAIPFWIKGQISRPIEILEEKAERLALGDLEDTTFKLKGRNDEIGKL